MSFSFDDHTLLIIERIFDFQSIASKATASVPAPVMNLNEVTSEITVEELIKSIGQKYLETTGKDGKLMAKQNYQRSNGYTLVNPTDDWFPGKTFYAGSEKEDMTY